MRRLGWPAPSMMRGVYGVYYNPVLGQVEVGVRVRLSELAAVRWPSLSGGGA
jgi:hypothetical protein